MSIQSMETLPKLPDCRKMMYFNYTPSEEIVMQCFLIKIIKSLEGKFKGFIKKHTIFWPKTTIMKLLAKGLINIRDNYCGCAL